MSGSPTIEQAVRVLRSGGLVAFPTETVYGLGADAGQSSAVQRIFRVKRRPTSHPLIVHVSGKERLAELAVEVPDIAWRLANQFWPGPLTLVVRRGPAISLEVTGGQETVALRVPNHPLALELLSAFGAGIVAPSANRFGRISPTCAAHVQRDLGNEVDCVLDGGDCNVGVESTIVDVTRGAPIVLRPGGIGLEALEDVVGKPLRVEDASSVRAPGQPASHYAPRATVQLVSRSELNERLEALYRQGARVGVMTTSEVGLKNAYATVRLSDEPAGFARSLYAGLRELDDRKVDVVLVVPPDERGVGLAVIDRLRRAAAPRQGAADEGADDDELE
ncbi:MAG TPA: L-threonylcarbamoyladenylate synthase [Polyangiaceae bacterium]|nr:L-threonylcarbamoyladenylate synthase [Polyangiaceae bacterium]